MGDIGEEKEVTSIPEPEWDEQGPPAKPAPETPREAPLPPAPAKPPEKVPA